jgi:hypothetical protein
MVRRSITNCAAGSDVSGSQSLDRKGVDIGFHEPAEGRIHQPVTFEWGLARKGFGDHSYPKMAAPVARTGVAGVQVAFVLNLNELRFKGVEEPFPDHFDSLFVHVRILI